MTAILYPVAQTADEALAAPKGRAAREREAQALAGEAVSFVSEPAGPAFASQEAALDAWAGRVEDARPGHALSLAAEDRFCVLAEQLAARGGRPPRPVRPSFRHGRRWPEPKGEPPATVWRLMVSYWRIGEPAQLAMEAGPQARQARRRGTEPPPPDALRALTRQPLRPVKPQQPLDIGLFETRLPEDPTIVVPDE